MMNFKIPSVKLFLSFAVALICFYFISVIKDTGNYATEKKPFFTNKDMTNPIVVLPSSERWNKPLSDEITIVTAYFNLGTFRKGYRLVHTTSQYYKWASVFRYIQNPLAVYTDSTEFYQLMKTMRNATMDRTRLFLIERNSSWGFKNLNKTRQIIATPGYPKHHPNTVIAEYSCVTHAKYDVTARAARENFFNTKYFAWLDIGYFRKRVSHNRFNLITPTAFNDTHIAMLEMFKKFKSQTPRSIFRNNLNWVGAGLALGTYDVIIAFETQYKRAVEYFISKGLANAEQQVIYAMFTEEGYKAIKPNITIQAYETKGDWFYLGNIMVKEV